MYNDAEVESRSRELFDQAEYSTATKSFISLIIFSYRLKHKHKHVMDILSNFQTDTKC
jgi:hypothetical protein